MILKRDPELMPLDECARRGAGDKNRTGAGCDKTRDGAQQG